MRFARNVRLAAVLGLITTATLLAMPPAWAASIAVTNLTGEGTTIGADVTKAVLGINMTGGTSFNGVDVVLTDSGTAGNFDLVTLSDLQGQPDGVAVYRDDGSSDDQLDGTDTLVSTGFTNEGGNVHVNVTSAVPGSAEGNHTFFLTVRTSTQIANGDDFTVEIPSPLLGCAFQTTPGTLFCSGETTGTITADTTVPTAAMTTAPTMVDGNVVWTFSEDVIGVSTSNVVLRADGSSTNIAASVTYDSGSRTATINPTANLTPGAIYDTIVNPASAATLVADAAGNQVATTPDTFSLTGVGFTPGVVRGNTWYLATGPSRTVTISFQFGSSTDYPIAGDWDGDGEYTVGVVRGNVWYLKADNGQGNTLEVAPFAFGSATDFPIVGDWDNNGTFTPGVVRGNVWYLKAENGPGSALEVPAYAFGKATDYPIIGDWDGIAATTPGLVRGNVWFLSNQVTPQTVTSFAFGLSTDFPIAGDWDDDADWTVGVVRGNSWHLTNSTPPGPVTSFKFGLSTDFPIVGDWDGPSSGGSSAGLLPKIVPGS